jgi:hypothetical protein
MKNMRISLPARIAVALICFIGMGRAQIGIPEIFPFNKENMALIKIAGGYNFDNDEYLDIVGIAALVDGKGEPIPRTSYIVHLEESASKDVIVQWKFAVPKGIKADFSDILVTDIDSDGLPEIVTALNISDVGRSTRTDWLYIFEYDNGFPAKPTALMDGTGKFATRPRPLFLHCGDIDDNKVSDIVISSGGPERRVVVISSNGPVSSENLEIIYHVDKLSTLEGALPFKAVAANVDCSPGDELVIFGGNNTLHAEIYITEVPDSVLKYSFQDISRWDFDLARLAIGDLDGDGIEEFIIPLKSGGAVLFSRQGGEFISNRFLPKKQNIAALLITDYNSNGLGEITYNVQRGATLFNLEYDLSGDLNDSDLYRHLCYDNPVLKGFRFIDIAAVLSASGEYTGSIVMPFINNNYNKHGLCCWRLEDVAPLDAVLGEIDLVLESKTTKPDMREFSGLVAGDQVVAKLSGIIGEEVPLSPMPNTKRGMVSTKSISEVYRPDILVHPGEKVHRKITIPGLTLDNLKDLNVNVKIPDGMKFNLAQKEFTWVPTDRQFGLHTIEAEFTWGQKRAVHSFTVYVNDRPVITSAYPVRDIIQIGESFKFNIQVEDNNDDAFLGYTLIDGPDGAIIEANGDLSWKPSFDQKDWYDFIIEISDGYDTDRMAFSLFVNHPVEIESAANPITSLGTKYHYCPVLNDNNEGFYVYWYDLSPRIENWRKSGIYETKILDDAVRNNLALYIKRYKRKFIAEDNPAEKAQNSHLIDDVFVFDGKLVFVFNIIDNKTPQAQDIIQTFFRNLGLSVPKYSNPERRYYYNYTLKEASAGLTMNDEGEIDWSPEKNQLGYNLLSYTVSDGYFTAEEHAQIYVNSPPVIVSTPDTIAYVNSLWQYEIKVTDLNTDSKLSYDLVDAPAGMTISPQGVISWKPSELQINDHVFSFKVSDGMSETIQKSRLFVNVKPGILSVPESVALTKLKWEYRLDAEDPNGDPLVYKAVRLPKYARFDPKTGILSWNPRKSQKGVNDIILEVTDSHGGSTLQEFQVHVFHNPGAKRFNFLRNTVSLLALIGLIYIIAR